MFQSAAETYKYELLGIILSGANHDGVEGAQTIINLGGNVWVQSPKTAEAKVLPGTVKETLNLQDKDCFTIDEILNKLSCFV